MLLFPVGWMIFFDVEKCEKCGRRCACLGIDAKTCIRRHCRRRTSTEIEMEMEIERREGPQTVAGLLQYEMLITHPALPLLILMPFTVCRWLHESKKPEWSFIKHPAHPRPLPLPVNTSYIYCSLSARGGSMLWFRPLSLLKRTTSSALLPLLRLALHPSHISFGYS